MLGVFEDSTATSEQQSILNEAFNDLMLDEILDKALDETLKPTSKDSSVLRPDEDSVTHFVDPLILKGPVFIDFLARNNVSRFDLLAAVPSKRFDERCHQYTF